MRMYRRLIVSIAAMVALLVATPAFGQSFKSVSFKQNNQAPAAQPQPNTGLGFGIHFGGTWTTASTDDDDVNIDQGAGVIAGIFFGGNRDGRAGLQGEISYLTKKVTASDAEDVEFGTQDLKNKYIQIPILLRINTGSRSNNGPCLFFLVGPSFDIKISDNAGDIFGQGLDDVYEGVEYGIMAGGGFEVARFGVQVRYVWGLNNIFGTDQANAAGFGDAKFNSLQITGIFRIN